jgi:hypothetical protein
MAAATAQIREFSVHERHVGAHHARVLEEVSFEAAAVAYIEGLHALEGDAPEISVIVRDLETGHEHCFLIDLDTGQAAPCG